MVEEYKYKPYTLWDMNTTLGKTPGFYLPKVDLEILASAQLGDCSATMALITRPRKTFMQHQLMVQMQ